MLNLKYAFDRAGSRTINQCRGNPSVYLDHWAIRKVSEDAALAARFRAALLGRGGSLALSLANLMEFALMTDLGQVALAEQFVDTLLPNIYFQQISFLHVIEAEKRKLGALPGGHIGPPDSDDILLHSFASDAWTRGTPLTMNDKFATMVRNPTHKQAFAFTKDLMLQKVERELIPQVRAHSKKETEAALLHGTPSRVEVMLLATVEYLANRQSPLIENDMIDLLHMLVPVSTCDYVLLDSNTSQTVTAVTNRMERLLGAKISLARVYKPAELEKFFGDLENGT
jgi:hypothetical protein